jgi:hypothetical protein
VALKNVCLVPRGWTLGDYKRHTCHDGSHSHLSVSQLIKLEVQGTARVIARPSTENPHYVAARVADYRIANVPAIRGRSCQLGEPLTLALAAKHLWARVMLADIRHRDVVEDAA